MNELLFYIENLIKDNIDKKEKVDKCQHWVNIGKNCKYFEEEIKVYNKMIEDNNCKITKAYEFINLSVKENLIITKSPLSNSFYAHKQDESIDWGVKPENSYRYSDHWQFGSRGKIHCEVDSETLKDMSNNDNWTAICKVVDGIYTKYNKNMEVVL